MIIDIKYFLRDMENRWIFERPANTLLPTEAFDLVQYGHFDEQRGMEENVEKYN